MRGFIGRNSFDQPITHSVGTGVATVTGAGSQWNISGSLSVGSGGHATLNVEAGGVVNNTDGYIGESLVPMAPDATAVATVTGSGSQWNNSLGLYLGGNDSTAAARGVLNVVDDGLVSVATTLKIWRTGTLNLDGGTVQAGTIDHTHGGRFNFLGGTLDVGIFDGNLTQSGGTIVIGSSPGITSVTGNYDQLDGAIEIEIFSGAGGAPVAGTDFDQLTADSVTLSGTLDLVADPGYLPALGDTLTIINTTSGVLGRFSAVNNVDLPGGLTLGVIYGANKVALEVMMVPESSGFALIAVGLLGVSHRRRKQA
jgi:T5SS/PEP-CTERM-associated repeat protein